MKQQGEREVKVKVMVLLLNDGALKVAIGLVGLNLFSFSVVDTLD
jgi:hypothetical protein